LPATSGLGMPPLPGNNQTASRKKRSSTAQECPPRIKSQIRSNSLILSLDTSEAARTKLSRTSRAASTSHAPVCSPFWNDGVKEISDALWCPTKTGSVASLSTSWRETEGSVPSTGPRSWFSSMTWKDLPHNQNLPKTSRPSTQSLSALHAVTTDNGQPTSAHDESPPKKKPRRNRAGKVIGIPQGSPTVMRTRKYRLHPSKTQAATIRRWMGTARWTYNRCLQACEKEGVGQADYKELRRRFVTLSETAPITD
jgi:hypothetical protein